jgi:hypothetical protein
MRALRILLALDSAILFLLGGLLLVLPEQVELAFGFAGLPAGVNYIVALWGCVLFTLAIGYWKASADPTRHVAWVQVGIARGALECGIGIIYLVRGVVTFRQAGVGTIVAGLLALAYLALYPRQKI